MSMLKSAQLRMRLTVQAFLSLTYRAAIGSQPANNLVALWQDITHT